MDLDPCRVGARCYPVMFSPAMFPDAIKVRANPSTARSATLEGMGVHGEHWDSRDCLRGERYVLEGPGAIGICILGIMLLYVVEEFQPGRTIMCEMLSTEMSA
jgi:hypothetical protein